jgi:asparagine synthase (glutamine-hydrolysing)
MCGIAGIYRYGSGRPAEEPELRGMAAALRHRGPDDEGVFVAGALGLASRRLEVIDLSSRGHQPMLSDDGALAIVYNGEIYNHLELRSELEARGHRFKSRCDTEVLLRLYEDRGDELLETLNGMFAFALWDGRRRRLLLARDRLGIKPLYLLETAEGIAFASEVRPLLPLLGRGPSMRLGALDSYLHVGYVPAPQTLFAEIDKLPPANALVVEDGRVSRRVWWEPPLRAGELQTWDEAQELVRHLLRDAVRLQLRSDVPLGVFLSGGVDSSAVVALVRELSTGEIRTFTAAYEFGSRFDETPFARLAATRGGARHEEIYITPAELEAAIVPTIRQLEEPVADPAAISLGVLARRARESVTVVLSGEGADEVFGGYPVHGHMAALERYRRLPPALRGMLAPALGAFGPKWRKYAALAAEPLERRYLGVSLADPLTLQRLLPPQPPAGESLEERLAPLYAAVAGADARRRMAHVDLLTWLPDDLLHKADRMTMASSLELRVPFLDHRLVELGLALPSRWRGRGWSTKRLLRSALSDVLPPAIARRGKVGFPVPLAALFRGSLGAQLHDLLDSPAAHLHDHFAPGVAVDLLDEHRAGRADHHQVLWQLLVLEHWHRELIAAPVAGPAPRACDAARSSG